MFEDKRNVRHWCTAQPDCLWSVNILDVLDDVGACQQHANIGLLARVAERQGCDLVGEFFLPDFQQLDTSEHSDDQWLWYKDKMASLPSHHQVCVLAPIMRQTTKVTNDSVQEPNADQRCRRRVGKWVTTLIIVTKNVYVVSQSWFSTQRSHILALTKKRDKY